MSKTKKSQVPSAIITGAVLDVRQDDIVIRGMMDPKYITHFVVGEYQREQRSPGRLSDMIAAVIKGKRFPEVELSLRSEQYSEAEPGVYHFYDTLHIVDGQQRSSATLLACQEVIGLETRFAVVVNIGKTIAWEKERFEELNLGKNREAVSNNVLLRNRKEDNPVVDHLWGIHSTDRTSALYKKVAWRQRVYDGEVISSWSLARIVCLLHEHRVPWVGTGFPETVETLNKIGLEFGPLVVRANVKAFFAAIDDIWNIRDIQVKAGAVHMRMASLTMLARVVSNHHDFWTNDKSVCFAPEMITRMRRFKFSDPHVANVLTKEPGRGEELAERFVDTLNHARRNKLRPRKKVVARQVVVESEAAE